MERVSIENGTAVLRLNWDEVRVLHQCLNEILNGVGLTDGEISTRLGARRRDLASMMHELDVALGAAE